AGVELLDARLERLSERLEVRRRHAIGAVAPPELTEKLDDPIRLLQPVDREVERVRELSLLLFELGREERARVGINSEEPLVDSRHEDVGPREQARERIGDEARVASEPDVVESVRAGQVDRLDLLELAAKRRRRLEAAVRIATETLVDDRGERVRDLRP